MLTKSKAVSILERVRNRRILVIGDFMIDEWVWGNVTRISPEAPIPVVQVTNHSFTLGGAGNVANNLCALGASVSLVATVGDDVFAGYAEEHLAEAGIGTEGLLRLSNRPTTRKTRVVAHSQQVVRADWEHTAPLSPEDQRRLVAKIRELAADADAVVLSDYAKGVLSEEVVQAALTCPVVLADPKPQNLDMYVGITCVAPNMHEASAATGILIVDDTSLEAAGTRLLSMLQCKYAVVTRGERGMSLFGQNGERLHIPSVARAVYDVSGAGDTVIAVLSSALAADVPIEDAVHLANYAAGAVVEKLGTATATPAEVISVIQHCGAGSPAECDDAFIAMKA